MPRFHEDTVLDKSSKAVHSRSGKDESKGVRLFGARAFEIQRMIVNVKGKRIEQNVQHEIDNDSKKKKKRFC